MKHPYIIKMLGFFIDAEKYVTKKPLKTVAAEPALQNKVGAALGNKLGQAPPPQLNKKQSMAPQQPLARMMSMQSSLMETNHGGKPPPKVQLKPVVADPKVIMVDTVQEKWYLCIVMEHASKGDVLQLIEEHKEKETYIDEAVIWRLAKQMGQGLEYLHKQHVIHRDIKPQNILITVDDNFKVRLNHN